jgi:Ca2+/Na+ antiporter
LIPNEVTFVAIGNGAPDLSSNINAIKSGNVLLSAGALTGEELRGEVFRGRFLVAEIIILGLFTIRIVTLPVHSAHFNLRAA